MKEINSIDEQIRPAHKYFYGAIALVITGAIFLGIGGAIESLVVVVLGLACMMLSPLLIVICEHIKKRAH